MKLENYLRKNGLTNLKIKTPYLEAEFELKQSDRDAAWELYIELLTRCSTQPVLSNDGDEAAALESLYCIFGITREIIKKYKCTCIQFAKIAIVVLNQVIRPFTTKWHKKLIEMEKSKNFDWTGFRDELFGLQETLKNYTHLLSEMACVEDLTDLEVY